MKYTSIMLLAASAAASALLPTVAFAQKPGGIMRMYHRGNPPSASIHEEATTSTVMPFAVVYNNLVMFDPKKSINTIDTIIPELATKWSWDSTKTKLTFTLRDDVKFHDGKPMTSADVKCTWDLLQGKAKGRLRKNPRKIWYHNLKDVTTSSPTSVTFNLNESAARIRDAARFRLLAGLSVSRLAEANAHQPDWYRSIQIRFVETQ